MTLVDRLHLSVTTGAPGYRRLQGLKLTQSSFDTETNNTLFSTFPLWSTKFGPSQDVRSVVKPAYKNPPIASYGKVLGDRNTLYKYLNPHLVAVITASTATPAGSQQQCSIYLLDSVKGTIIYHAPISTISGPCDIKATLVDNWLVYHYYEDDVSKPGTAKGYRMVSVELYEGHKVNEKSSRWQSFTIAQLYS